VKTNENLVSKLKTESRVNTAVDYFMSGYNCAQAVFAAYCDLFGIPAEQGLLISAGLGGGVGRMREVCGTIVGSAMILGLAYGNTDTSDVKTKAELYKRVQTLASEFKEENGTIICRDLVGNLAKNKDYIPDERTAEYYKKRPCVKIVGDAARLLEQQLLENC